MVLADEQPFALGELTVRPALRQVVCADSSEHILEPRVMQVLVALAKAQGGIVSRDKLFEQCWEGRIVGEDAINRVIGRLRQFAQADAASAFRIETIPRVGYRLILRDQPEPQVAATPFADPAALIPIDPPPVTSPNRRALLVGAGTAAVVAAGGAAWWATRPTPPLPSPKVSSELTVTLARALSAARRSTPDGAAEALGILKQLVQVAPDYADAWGVLALVYAFDSHAAKDPEASRLQSQAALARAFALDPHNPFAYGARAALYPRRTLLIEREDILREGLRYHPTNSDLLYILASVLDGVGRISEAASLLDKVIATSPADTSDPGFIWFHIQTLWGANRLQEADAAAQKGRTLFPRQIYVWWTQFYLLLFTGRADAAFQLAADVDGRPPGVPDVDFERQMLVATAMKTGDRVDQQKAAAALIEMAHQGAGYAENAIMELPAIGHVDDAYAVADALYFNRGFTVGQFRFSPEQRVYTPLLDRKTRPLFSPPARAMRRDPRFPALMAELEIAAYWKKRGVKPDYQAGGDG